MRVGTFFSVAHLEDRLAQLDRYVRRTKSTVRRAQLTEDRKSVVAVLVIAQEYETERQRILDASGFDAAHARYRASAKALAEHVFATLKEPPVTMAGVLIHAEAVEAANGLERLDRWQQEATSGADWAQQLATSILRMAQAQSA